MQIKSQTRVDVSEIFSADKLWFRILSGLFQRCSLPENLWTALIQLWTALKTEILRAKNQRWNSADFLWNRADSELNSADFLWNSAETGNFQSKKISAESELFQRWFSLKQSWFSLKQRWNTKFSEQKISAVSALIFSETELTTVEAFWNSSYHSWFSPETTLNIPEFCVFQFLSSPDFFAIFLQGNVDITLFRYLYLIASRQKLQRIPFLPTYAKLKSYGFWKLRSHYFSAKNRSYSLSADFFQETPDLEISGILDLSLFSQISTGKLRSYLSWKFRNYSAMAKLYLVLFPQIFSKKPQILRSLEI